MNGNSTRWRQTADIGFQRPRHRAWEEWDHHQGKALNNKHNRANHQLLLPRWVLHLTCKEWAHRLDGLVHHLPVGKADLRQDGKDRHLQDGQEAHPRVFLLDLLLVHLAVLLLAVVRLLVCLVLLLGGKDRLLQDGLEVLHLVFPTRLLRDNPLLHLVCLVVHLLQGGLEDLLLEYLLVLLLLVLEGLLDFLGDHRQDGLDLLPQDGRVDLPTCLVGHHLAGPALLHRVGQEARLLV